MSFEGFDDSHYGPLGKKAPVPPMTPEEELVHMEEVITSGEATFEEFMKDPGSYTGDMSPDELRRYLEE
jgi:hypothetical protein